MKEWMKSPLWEVWRAQDAHFILGLLEGYVTVTTNVDIGFA